MIRRNLITEEFSSLFPEKGLAVGFMKVDVIIRPNGLLTELAYEYEKEVKRLTRFTVGEVSDLDFIKYFTTLLYLHVKRVNGDGLGEYLRFSRQIFIPAAFATVLMQIGTVEDLDFGLKFIPKIEVSAKEIMSPGDLEEMSLLLRSLESYGLVCVHKFPRPEDCGSLEAMAASLIESGDVLAYKQGHPVHGFITALLNISATKEVLGVEALRIRYGTLSHYQTLLGAFVRSSVGALRDKDEKA